MIYSTAIAGAASSDPLVDNCCTAPHLYRACRHVVWRDFMMARKLAEIDSNMSPVSTTGQYTLSKLEWLTRSSFRAQMGF